MNGQEKKLVLAAGIPFKPGYRVTPFDAGGGGLISTARDYMRFLEMLRSLGKFNELQILSPKTIKFMTKDHLPRRITDANIGPDHDRNLGIGGGHGLGIGVYIDPIRRGVLSSKGELDWGGAAGTVYWWDPEEVYSARLVRVRAQTPEQGGKAEIRYLATAIPAE